MGKKLFVFSLVLDAVYILFCIGLFIANNIYGELRSWLGWFLLSVFIVLVIIANVFYIKFKIIHKEKDPKKFYVVGFSFLIILIAGFLIYVGSLFNINERVEIIEGQKCIVRGAWDPTTEDVYEYQNWFFYGDFIENRTIESNN